jgi:hypothetical protein
MSLVEPNPNETTFFNGLAKLGFASGISAVVFIVLLIVGITTNNDKGLIISAMVLVGIEFVLTVSSHVDLRNSWVRDHSD